jgi:hypothetical protein
MENLEIFGSADERTIEQIGNCVAVRGRRAGGSLRG